MQGKKSLFVILLVLVLVMGGAYALYGRLSAGAEPDLVTPETEDTDPAGSDDSSGGFSDAPGAGEIDEPIQAPDFTVYDADGSEVSLSDYAGTPVVLNFWASWCPPCKSEMPDFEEASKTYEGKVAFMMVNLTDGGRETVDTAKAYIEEQGYTFPIYFDTQQEAAIGYGVVSIPTTYFIDAQGGVVAYGQGALDQSALEQGIGMIPGE